MPCADLVFIVAAPQDNAGVMAKSTNNITNLSLHILQESLEAKHVVLALSTHVHKVVYLVSWVQGIRIHKLLPHHYAQLVTKVVKPVRLVQTSTPVKT